MNDDADTRRVARADPVVRRRIEDIIDAARLEREALLDPWELSEQERGLNALPRRWPMPKGVQT